MKYLKTVAGFKNIVL